jgi:hypothetical protein
MSAVVDTTADKGRFLTTRSTVYPEASVVSDRIQLTYLRQGWNPNESLYYGEGWHEERLPLHVELTIRDAAGRPVWRVSRESSVLTFNFAWHARGPGGNPLPEGSYDARVVVTDTLGNRSSFTRTVVVSHAQLRPEVWTSTVAAGAATTYSPEYSPGCNDCGMSCRATPSRRFPGGVSFHGCTSFSFATTYFVATPPLTAAPVDTFRITATGGPSTPGSDDVGSIAGQTIGPGDASATTPWRRVRLNVPPYLSGQQRAVTFWFGTSDDNSYDVATFTIEYRYYVPA